MCLLLQYQLQSCSRGGRLRWIVEDMCYESEKDEEPRSGVFYLARQLKTHRGVDMCRQRLLFFLLCVVKITHVNMQKKILLSPTSSKSFFRVYPPSPKISKICTKPISLIPTDANGKIGNTEPG